jgi:tripartite-type tricarboxylate transporter receptor subunit TctC
MQDRFRQMGMEAASSTPEGMTERLRKDLERWRDVIGKLGLRQ